MQKLENATNKQRLEYLRYNASFWGRLDGDDGYKKSTATIKNIFSTGINVFSVSLPLGWIGVDEYDFSVVDEKLDAFFGAVPNAYLIPRVSLNVPISWCYHNPNDVHVYFNGPTTANDVRKVIDTPLHDLMGGDVPASEKNPRANVGGVVCLQSFSSDKWRDDASVALTKLMRHVLTKPYGKNIIGYHVAYGMCGETAMWGGWETNILRHGDYGINTSKKFEQFAKSHNLKTTQIPSAIDRGVIKAKGETVSDVSALTDYIVSDELGALFYSSAGVDGAEEYSRFLSLTNVESIERFCKTVKRVDENYVTGAFYGYVLATHNCANTAHLGINKLLSSPYVDFVAGPKGYYRVRAGEPGYPQAVSESINRKKLWLDEADNRTHLADKNHDASVGQTPSASNDMHETRSAYWREFSKNLMSNQGFWWMDLLGGWFDDDEIINEIAVLKKTGDIISQKKGKSVAEVLLVFDDDVLHKLRPNKFLHFASTHEFCARVKECGTPVETLRRCDLDEISDLTQYKAIIFLNNFTETVESFNKIKSKMRSDVLITFNYASGIYDNGVSVQNVSSLTGFDVRQLRGETVDGIPKNFPLLYANDSCANVIKKYDSGKAMLLYRKCGDATYVFNALPAVVTADDVRRVLELAGVHFYAPVYTTVNADNRFVYVTTTKSFDGNVTLKEKRNCKDLFNGKRYSSVTQVPVSLKAGHATFILYED